MPPGLALDSSLTAGIAGMHWIGRLNCVTNHLILRYFTGIATGNDLGYRCDRWISTVGGGVFGGLKRGAVARLFGIPNRKLFLKYLVPSTSYVPESKIT